MIKKVSLVLIILLLSSTASVHGSKDFMWDTDAIPFIKLPVMSKFVITIVNFVNETYGNITLDLPDDLWVQRVPDARNYSSSGWGWIFINSSYYIMFLTPDFNWSGQGYIEDCEGWVVESSMEYIIDSEPEPVTLAVFSTQPIQESPKRVISSPGRVIYEDGLWYGTMWKTPHLLISVNLRDVNHGGQGYTLRLTINSGSSLSEEYPIVREYRIRPRHEWIAIYLRPETVLNQGTYNISIIADTIVGLQNPGYKVAYSNSII